MTVCSMEIELGAYVLDALEPDEAAAVRGHLDHCERCREEAGSLAATASVLSLLTLDDIERLAGELSQEPATGRTARATRQRRIALAAAGTVLVGGTVLGATHLHDHSTPPAAVVRAADPGTHVRATVTMSSRSWGTALHVELTGAPPTGWCSLVAHARDGRVETAAYWVADRDGVADVDGTTAIRTADLSSFEVVTDTGRRLLRIDAGHRGT
jgi:hypothetical protein